MIELLLACQLQLTPPALGYKSLPDSAVTQELQNSSMSCQSDKPADAYAVVARHAKPNVPVSIQPYMDRKTVKRVVMTVPYNAKPHSNRGYIRDALKEKGVEVEKDDLTATVKAVRDAMDEVVPGPMAAMKWIEAEVAKAIKRGATELEWVTPSGFIVTQKLNKKLLNTVTCSYLVVLRSVSLLKTVTRLI